MKKIKTKKQYYCIVKKIYDDWFNCYFYITINVFYYVTITLFKDIVRPIKILDLSGVLRRVDGWRTVNKHTKIKLWHDIRE